MNYKIIVSPIASKNIEDALGVFLDFLVRESKSPSFDKRTLQRIQELELLEESKKQTLFDLTDTYIRDFKTRGAILQFKY